MTFAGKGDLAGLGRQLRIAVIDPQPAGIGIHAIQPFFGERDLGALEQHRDGVVLEQLADFEHRGTRQHLDARIRQLVRNHIEGAVFGYAQKYARRQENFGSTIFGGQCLPGFNIRKLAGLHLNGLAVELHFAFGVLDDTGMCGNHALRPGGRRHSETH